jgi:nucleoside-diphosphate-sugar epimerase
MALGARVFRLPGIYGPGRSPLDRLRAGTAHLVEASGQVFSRVHVDDLAAGVIAGLGAPAGAYNLADDLPASANEVTAHAARLLGMAMPAVVPLASLSPMAQGFYAENRRVANGKAKRVLGWQLRYRDYRSGLRALSATTSPTPVTAAPAIASDDHR